MKIFGTFSASLTPFNDDYSINNELFFNHCNQLLNEGADGIAIFGSTGEANLISLNVKIEAMHDLIERGIDPSKLIPGTGLPSIEETIKLSTLAKDLSMGGVLVLPSYYYNNPTDEGVIDYYSKIVDSIAEENFKIILYHIPQLSGVFINTNIISNLIKKYPNNIVGIKDSSNDLNNMINTIKSFPDFCVLSGSDSLALSVMREGGAGAITATANLSASLLSFIVNNANNLEKSNDLQKAHTLQDKIRRVVFSQEQISFMKAIMTIKSQNVIWKNIMPPLVSLKDSKNNKNIQETLKLLEDMNKLSSNF